MPGPAARPARRPGRQVRLEGPVRHARGVRRRRLRQRDRPGQPADGAGPADRRTTTRRSSRDLDRDQFRAPRRVRRHAAPARSRSARRPGRAAARAERGKDAVRARSAAPSATRPTSAASTGVYSDFLLHRLDDREQRRRRLRHERLARGPAARGLPAARGVEDAPALGRGRLGPVLPRRRLADPGAPRSAATTATPRPSPPPTASCPSPTARRSSPSSRPSGPPTDAPKVPAPAQEARRLAMAK